jgi:hypothetical protein
VTFDIGRGGRVRIIGAGEHAAATKKKGKGRDEPNLHRVSKI